MRTKKKASQAPSVEKQPQNKLKTIITSDGKEYKVMDSLLMKYSMTIRGILQDDKFDEDIKLLESDGESFEYVIKFMELHKDNDPQKIHFPLKSNQDVKLVMQENDAELVLSILNKDEDLTLFKKVLDSTSYLQVEDFKKRLMSALTIKLLKSTVDELKTEFQIKQNDINQEQLRRQCIERLKHISELKDE